MVKENDTLEISLKIFMTVLQEPTSNLIHFHLPVTTLTLAAHGEAPFDNLIISFSHQWSSARLKHIKKLTWNRKWIEEFLKMFAMFL